MLPEDGGMSACSPGCKASKMPPQPNEDVALFITVNLDRFIHHVMYSIVFPYPQYHNGGRIETYFLAVFMADNCVKNTSGLAPC